MEQELHLKDLSPELEVLQSWLSHSHQASDWTVEQQCSILFIVRLCNALHAAGNATFITDSWVEDLKMGFQVPMLGAQFEIGAIRWSCASFYAVHPVSGGLNAGTLQEISKIAEGARSGKISPSKGHELLWMLENRDDDEDDSKLGKFRKFMNSNWGLYVMYPLGAASFGMVIFGATQTDAAFGIISGLLTAIILHAVNLFPELASVSELLISIAASMVAATSFYYFPDASCYTEQTLGSLTFFLYGYACVISLYEITSSNNVLLTGITRFATAILKTYILAGGVVLGSWFAVYAGESRVGDFLDQDCSNLSTQPGPYGRLLYAPMAFIAILLHVGVSPTYWPVCFVPLTLAYLSQYTLDVVLEQPIMVVNTAPAFIATIASYASIALAHRLNLTDLQVSTSAYISSLSSPFISTAQSTRPRLERRRGQRNLRRSSMVLPATGDDRLLHCQRSDLWYCLVPTLILLVPGGSVWRIAFFSVLESMWPNDYGSSESSLGQLVAGVLVVAISQVIGVRLGFTAISLYASLKELWHPRKQFETNSPEDLDVVDLTKSTVSGFSV